MRSCKLALNKRLIKLCLDNARLMYCISSYKTLIKVFRNILDTMALFDPKDKAKFWGWIVNWLLTMGGFVESKNIPANNFEIFHWFYNFSKVFFRNFAWKLHNQKSFAIQLLDYIVNQILSHLDHFCRR